MNRQASELAYPGPIRRSDGDRNLPQPVQSPRCAGSQPRGDTGQCGSTQKLVLAHNGNIYEPRLHRMPGLLRAGKPSIRSNLLAVLCAFDSVAEALKIVGRTVGELEEFREQVLDAVELDAELAGLEVDVRGQGGDLVAGLGAQGNFHGGGLEVFANAFELGHQPPTPTLLIAERLAVSHGFELVEKLLAVDEESSAGLVAAEAVQQLDGLSAFEAEEFFDHGAVEDGDREPAEFLDNAGNMKQPKGLWGQGGLSLLATRYHTVVRNEVFPGGKITYHNVPYRRLSGVAVFLDPQIPLCCPCGSFQLFCRGWWPGLLS